MAFAERTSSGEKIGGGFFVYRRGKKTGRIGVRLSTVPFEHPNLESAQIEVRRLSELSPGEKFVIFQEVSS